MCVQDLHFGVFHEIGMVWDRTGGIGIAMVSLDREKSWMWHGMGV